MGVNVRCQQKTTHDMNYSPREAVARALRREELQRDLREVTDTKKRGRGEIQVRDSNKSEVFHGHDTVSWSFRVRLTKDYNL